MFKLLYRIVEEDIQIISQLGSKNFEQVYGDISGQISLNFNGHEIGFCHDDVPYGNELLMQWFKRLNEVLFSLEKTNYIAMNVVENNRWIEFVKMDKCLKVSLIEDPVSINLHQFITGNRFLNYRNRAWRDVKIDYYQFKSEIISNTLSFLVELESINAQLLNTSNVIRINQILHSLDQNIK